MPEHWYSNSYLIGSQTVRQGGGYGGRGFFDEDALKQQTLPGQAQAAQAQAQEDEVTEFTFTSGGYQGSIGTPEAGTSGEWYIENLLEELDGPNEW